MTDTPDTKERPSAGGNFNWSRPSTYPWIVFGISGLIGLLLGFTYRANVIPAQAQFFATNLLSVLALIVIIVQAYYYGRQRDIMAQQWIAMDQSLQQMKNQAGSMKTQAEAALKAADMASRQLEAMERQEKAMRDQVKLMDKSLVLGTRAYVGIHSIKLEHETERILFEIENIGRVPAKDIQVVYEQIIRIPEFVMPETPDGTHYGWHWKEITRYGVKRGEWQLRIPWLHTYGPTKLFPGSLRIKVVVPLGENFYVTPDQYRVIISGDAEIIVRGCITYSDGFHKGKRTEFAFSYQKGGVWIPVAETGMDQYQTDPEKPDSDYSPN